MLRVNDQTGFVLHSNPYRETSLLVDLFTRDSGRLRCVAKGYRKSGRLGATKSLRPFVEYRFAWQGRSELKTLTSAEVVRPAVQLQGAAMYTSLYINELLYRLLHEGEPHQLLFDAYRELIEKLYGGNMDESGLRVFELTLLEELGYGLVLDCEAATGDSLHETGRYRYLPEQGLVRAEEKSAGSQAWLGGDLVALSRRDFSSKTTLSAAKQLLRQVLDYYLGGKPLHSRQLYRQYLNG